MSSALELTVHLHKLHPSQLAIKQHPAKRKIIRAGRRAGKTVLASDIAVDGFLDGQRILYATPTDDQLETFWHEVKQALQEPLDAGIFYKNETKHIISRAETKNRIRAKTAYNADTLRGDNADLLILDEYQDIDPDAWELVGAPMLLDNDGDAIFIYTKKRLGKSAHADRLYRRAAAEGDERWKEFTFSSHDNPFISAAALEDITRDMSRLAYRMEIEAEDVQDDPSALWTRDLIERGRVLQAPELARILVGVDPSGGPDTECGIVAGGVAYHDGQQHLYFLDDASMAGKPDQWGRAVVVCYHRAHADRVIGEGNYGGDMVENTLRVIDPNISYEKVTATRGKAVRAEPVQAMYEQGRVHHVGHFPELEDEMCTWVPGTGQPSPNRLDAAVWVAIAALGLSATGGIHA